MTEFEPTLERVRDHGEHEQIKLPTGAYVKMSQVRREPNKVSEELKDSIEARGLMSQLHVARMSRENLADYIDFVNQLWKSDTTIDEFDLQKQADGFYYLIIDGHSRHQAIEELESEGRLAPGRIVANVYDVTSPYDIIALQLDGNIYAAPPRERRAIAIVESYEWGVCTGLWRNRQEFLVQNHAASESTLAEALSFSYLPTDVRKYVLAGKIPYTAGIELGRAVPDVTSHIAFKTGIDKDASDETQKTMLNEAILNRLIVEVQYIAGAKLNSTAAEKRIRGWRENLRKELQQPADEAEAEAFEADALFELGLKDSSVLLAEDIAASKKKIAEFMRAYGRTPVSAAEELLHLAAPYVEPEVLKEIYKDFTINRDRGRRRIGEQALMTPEAGSSILDSELERLVDSTGGDVVATQRSGSFFGG